ncbi:hypothetical protein Ddc_11691 [Ditylenchus destructor]|nr:hypothetical protein Ddc_11691 [Ditylenchus destructor]
MDFFGQVRQGFAKAVQKAAPDFQVFNEFPECSILSSTDRVSIKVKDLSVNNPQWKPIAGTDNQLIYSIRNEDNRKQLLMNAHFHCTGSDQGVVLKNMAGKAIMIVGLPNHSINSIGKLLHPTSATMYKIMVNPGTFDYTVIKGPSNEPILRIERVFVSLYPIGKAVGLLSSDCVYWMKRLDGTILGYVRPKLVMKSTTLVVKFTSTQKDAQIRAVMLGAATLLMISRVHPHIRNRLEDSMRLAQIH